MSHRVSAEIEGDFVVFILGMHINRPLRVREWLPVVLAMPPMIRELLRHPELGMLGSHWGWMFGGLTVVQYWRSHEDLVAYARSTDAGHLPAWKRFNRAATTSDAAGIFHETYHVREGQWETVYVNMPRIGLRRASRSRPLARASSSASRMAGRGVDDPQDREPAVAGARR